MTLKEKIAIILNSDNGEDNQSALHIVSDDIKSKEDFFILLNSIPYVIDKIIFYKKQIDKYKIRDEGTIELGKVIYILQQEFRSIRYAVFESFDITLDYRKLSIDEITKKEKSWCTIMDNAENQINEWPYMHQPYYDEVHKGCKLKTLKTLKTLSKRVKKLFSSEDLMYSNKNIEDLLSLDLNKNIYVISSSYFSKDTKIEELEKSIFPIFDKEGIKLNCFTNNKRNDFLIFHFPASYDLNDDDFEENENGEIKYHPNLTEFNIFNESLSEKLVVSYLRKNVDIKIKETNDFLQYMNENGKPFLLLSSTIYSSNFHYFRILKSKKKL